MADNKEQLSLDFLAKDFKVSLPRKTLKTKVHKDTPLENAVLKAFRFVLDNREGYTAMEFPYGSCYIVVARLKDSRES